MEETPGIMPWLFCLGTAVWFGLMAWKAGYNRTAWACGGGVLALLTSTLVWGVRNASCIPVSPQAPGRCEIEACFLTLAILLLVGWLLTWNLHGRGLSIFKRLRPEISNPNPPAQPGNKPGQRPPGK